MKIDSLTLPDNLKAIGKNIFGASENYQTELISIIIPDSVKYIDSSFLHNKATKEFIVDKNNTSYSHDKGILYNKDKTELIRCPKSSPVMNYTLPESVISIDNSAFFYCSNINILNINDKAETIGSYAFAYCYSLKELNLGKNLKSIGNNSLATLYSKSPVMNINTLTLPDSLNIIGKNIFNDNIGMDVKTKIDSIIIPESVKYVDSVFLDNNATKEFIVDKNNNIYSSDKGILYKNNSLLKCPLSSDILIYDVLPNTKSISENAFSNTKIQNIFIPSSVTEIGENAFYNSDLKTIRGVSGTYAETYASENNYTFETTEENTQPEQTEDNDKLKKFDLNGDGKVNIMDVAAIKRFILGAE